MDINGDTSDSGTTAVIDFFNWLFENDGNVGFSKILDSSSHFSLLFSFLSELSLIAISLFEKNEVFGWAFEEWLEKVLPTPDLELGVGLCDDVIEIGIALSISTFSISFYLYFILSFVHLDP